MPQDTNLPPLLKHANRMMLLLHNAGVAIGPPHILVVPGRTSGEPRPTPVSIVSLDGDRYVVAGRRMSWVKNVRAARAGSIQRGRRREPVRFTEMEPHERGPVLRAYWHQHSQGRKIAAQIFEAGPDASADDFAEAAPRCAVFRLDPVTDERAA